MHLWARWARICSNDMTMNTDVDQEFDGSIEFDCDCLDTDTVMRIFLVHGKLHTRRTVSRLSGIPQPTQVEITEQISTRRGSFSVRYEHRGSSLRVTVDLHSSFSLYMHTCDLNFGLYA